MAMVELSEEEVNIVPGPVLSQVDFESKTDGRIGALPVNIFNGKEVSNRFPDMRVPNVLLPPQNSLGFLAQKRQNLAKN